MLLWDGLQDPPGEFFSPARTDMKGTSQRNRTGLGIALGTGLGAIAGVIFGRWGLWLSLGIVIGMLIGGILGRSPSCPECAAAHPSPRTAESISYRLKA